MTGVFAHRGAHLRERENTLAAFRCARGLGVTGVELDVRRTVDGALVVHHDPVLDARPIAHTFAAQLPTYVPSLAQALEELTGLVVNVEVKNARGSLGAPYDESSDLIRQVLDEIHAAPNGSSILLSCFDVATCEMARRHDPTTDVAWLVSDVELDVALARARELGFQGVNPHFSLVTPESCELASSLGLALHVWTVNAPRDIHAMSARGVAGIITDQPALALELLAAGSS